MRSVERSVPSRIARVSTAAASWSGLPAPIGALTRAANHLVVVLREVLLAGSAQASVDVTVEPTLAPAANREAVVFLTRSASAPGAMTRLSLIHISEPTRLGMISYA